MGVVHLFGQRSSAAKKETRESFNTANCNEETGQVVELTVNANLAKNVPAKQVYRQLETLMATEGLDFGCEKNKSDFKIISYLVQGMFDRQDGVPSPRSFLGETLRHVFQGEETSNDSNELFGDLLGKI